jgi:hypothetical protein
MLYYIKLFFKYFRIPIDFFFLIFIVPAALILLIYRRVGSGRLPINSLILKRIGVFPIRNHYYEPLFDDRLITISLDKDRDLPGIDMKKEAQVNLLKCLCFSDELVALELNKNAKNTNNFHIDNGSFGSGDAEFLYQFLRHIKPSKVLEIGSGNSTKIARLALNKNDIDTNYKCKHICIEPYEQPWLESLDGINVLRSTIENCSFDWSSELKSGDLLFVDSSHIIRPQGDVLKIYLAILPMLPKGVYVHVHDIFTPKDYLKTWLVDDVKFWNEQYLLEAVLGNTNRYEVIASLNYLKHKEYELLNSVCPYLTKNREPGSFYFRIK